MCATCSLPNPRGGNSHAHHIKEAHYLPGTIRGRRAGPGRRQGLDKARNLEIQAWGSNANAQGYAWAADNVSSANCGLPFSVAGLVARYIDGLPPHAEFSTGDIVRHLETCGVKDENKLRMNISCILGRLMSDAKGFSRVKRGRFVKDMGQSEAVM